MGATVSVVTSTFGFNYCARAGCEITEVDLVMGAWKAPLSGCFVMNFMVAVKLFVAVYTEIGHFLAFYPREIYCT